MVKIFSTKEVLSAIAPIKRSDFDRKRLHIDQIRFSLLSDRQKNIFIEGTREQIISLLNDLEVRSHHQRVDLQPSMEYLMELNRSKNK